MASTERLRKPHDSRRSKREHALSAVVTAGIDSHEVLGTRPAHDVTQRNSMTETMLVRASGGSWEQLQPQTAVPDGGLIEMFGEDIGPVLGAPAPMLVAGVNAKLDSGSPDAICLDVDGNITIIAMALTGGAESTLPSLLAFAGSLNGMSYDAFEQVCGRVEESDDGLAGFVHRRAPHADFHRGTFEVTVADALANGRFSLVAMVATAPPMLTQSMRYLNSSGASVACYEATIFASSSVLAVQAHPVDVGYQLRTVEIAMTAAGLFAVTERTNDERTADLVAQIQKFCAGAFDDVVYEGDSDRASMSALLRDASGAAVPFVSVDSGGTVVIRFDSLASMDQRWIVRAELVQGMNRLLGAELGAVKKISQLNLDIREHLNDATLVEMLTEILGDTVQMLRAEGDVAAGRTGAVGAAA